MAMANSLKLPDSSSVFCPILISSALAADTGRKHIAGSDCIAVLHRFRDWDSLLDKSRRQTMDLMPVHMRHSSVLAKYLTEPGYEGLHLPVRYWPSHLNRLMLRRS